MNSFWERLALCCLLVVVGVMWVGVVCACIFFGVCAMWPDFMVACLVFLLVTAALGLTVELARTS